MSGIWRDKPPKTLIVSLIVVITALTIALCVHDCPIPTPLELQQMLVDVGYDLELDGRVGVKTVAALEDYEMQEIIYDMKKRYP